MPLLSAIRDSYGLLPSRARTRLVLAVIVQAALSVLDLAGVVLIGLTGALAVLIVEGQTSSSTLLQVAEFVGLAGVQPEQLLALVAAVASALLLGKSLLSTILLRRTFQFLASCQVSISTRLTRALMYQPIAFINQRTSQQTSYALSQGVAAVTLLILGQAAVAISEFVLVLLMSIMLLFLSPSVALSAMVYFAGIAILLHLSLGRWATRSGRRVANADVDTLHAVQEALATYREVSVLCRRQYYVDLISVSRSAASSGSADMQFLLTLPKYILEVALVVGGFALAAYLFATTEVVSAVGVMALFLAASMRIMPSLLRLQGALLMLRSASGAALPSLELARQLTEHGESDPRVTIGETLGAEIDAFEPCVVVDDVTYTYAGTTQPAIRKVSFELEAGSALAIAGRSGAGKSTMADLLLGVLTPDAGTIKIGGLDPIRVSTQWPGSMSYVPQRSTIVNSTVKANVALGIPEMAIDEGMVWKALELAGLADVVRYLPDGINTGLGENGIRLSGGQLQRVGIARALYPQPRLILFDEATSALDIETEAAIAAVLESMRGKITRIVIAHRLSTVVTADKVLYLEQGRTLAYGSFADVRRVVPSLHREAELMGL